MAVHLCYISAIDYELAFINGSRASKNQQKTTQWNGGLNSDRVTWTQIKELPEPIISKPWLSVNLV